ncbi:MAG: hypothetical protein OER80_13725 [Gammaproteobacteria bacterium]|nr:hypothetical protein [Gammaproteobacteria bacterium]
MSDDIRDRWSVWVAIAFFALIALLIILDVIVDFNEGASIGHIAIELLVVAVAATGIGVLMRQLMRTRTSLAQARVEAEQWRKESRELIQGLAIAIENQFDRWQLTKAEAEVGLLLLKGLSHKEIATVRQTSERTAREQARAVYRKSGLTGRPALSAFFLEDLLPTQTL